MPAKLEKYFIMVDLPAPIFPSTDTRNGRSDGVVTFISVFSGDSITMLDFLFVGVSLVGLCSGRFSPAMLIINPSISDRLDFE